MLRADQMQQLVVTGHYANGGIRDLTRQVSSVPLIRRSWRVDANGLLTSTKNGTTKVVAELQGKAVKVSVTVEGVERAAEPSSPTRSCRS